MLGELSLVQRKEVHNKMGFWEDFKIKTNIDYQLVIEITLYVKKYFNDDDENKLKELLDSFRITEAEKELIGELVI